MNTIGKVLVIFVFLFAILVCVLSVVDFATRTKWKTAYEDLKREHDVVVTSRDVKSQTGESVFATNKALQTEVDKLKLSIADTENTARLKEAELQVKINDQENLAKTADILRTKALADVERYKELEKDLNKTIAEREKQVLIVQKQSEKYRGDAIANETLAKTLQTRNEQLLEEITQLNYQLAKAKSGVGVAGAEGSLSTKFGEGPNPPSTMVKGQIEKVHGDDKTLVQISLGSDHGVAKNNTLEVFRTRPEAKYLGMVRIIDVQPRTSVGRLIVPAGSTARPQLVAGDQVWSYLSK